MSYIMLAWVNYSHNHMNSLVPEFIEFLPMNLEDGKLYISMKYCTAVHLCACGCGERVVTPLQPNGWKLSFDGLVTLRPSIGNFEYPCMSHYFITDNEIQWLPKEVVVDKNKKKKTKKRKKIKFKRKFPFLSIM